MLIVKRFGRNNRQFSWFLGEMMLCEGIFPDDWFHSLTQIRVDPPE